ncbi:MAG: DNA mismatch repair endonuclease MutL [Thermoplasmata archaeon]|nr:DNA mismatch repair endonuclease MutL [Thermoplasmata archaeon]
MTVERAAGTATATGSIHRLGAEAIAAIAAGEVVERPASVVKELVENAVDAGATEVLVVIEGGGIDRIEVIDDGQGIAADDLPLAVERHATSKLTSAEELPRLRTLGFRGEALASIGAAARLALVSRPPGAAEAHGLILEAGRPGSSFVAGGPAGTRVEVRDLFGETPARRKFLRSPATEQVEIRATLERLYLARPGVGLELRSADRELGRFPPARSVREAADRVFGPEFSVASFAVAADDGQGLAVSAQLSRPVLSTSGSQRLMVSVNGRSIVARALSSAIRQAYVDYLPRGRFPMGAVQLAVDPARVDVNVHPTKREVRFERERDVAEFLRSAVRRALREEPHAALRPAAGAPAASRAPTLVPGEAPSVAPQVLRSASPPAATADRQRQLGEATGETAVAPDARHPRLVLRASLFDLYWVAEGADELVLVDQHAASERVIFDHLLATGQLARQELVDPVRVELTARQSEVLRGHAEEVRKAGYTVEPFGGTSWRVLAVPAYRGRRIPADRLAGLLEEIGEGGRPTTPDGFEARTAATIACHAAVRGGERISAEEMGRILEQLYALPDAAYACPHGRPILIQLPRARLDSWFLRSRG